MEGTDCTVACWNNGGPPLVTPKWSPNMTCVELGEPLPELPPSSAGLLCWNRSLSGLLTQRLASTQLDCEAG